MYLKFYVFISKQLCFLIDFVFIDRCKKWILKKKKKELKNIVLFNSLKSDKLIGKTKYLINLTKQNT